MGWWDGREGGKNVKHIGFLKKTQNIFLNIS
jgi:hypothetical protein